MAEDLRIGVIGCGGRGRLARHAHKPGEGSRLVAGCDIRQVALDDFRANHGEDAFVCNDYRDLLAQPGIDAVFVCTPDYWHEEHALAALDAGKHVYLEKPMAITVPGADRVLTKAREKGLKLYVGHNMRHMSFVRKMKEIIDRGGIGEVKAGWCRHFVAYGGDAYFKDWHAEQSKATSMLLQKGAHDIDILHWLCHGYTKRVIGFGNLTVYNQITDRHDPSERGDASWHLSNWPPLSQKGMNPIIDVEDLSMITMQLDNEVICSYQQCHYTPDGWRNYTIIGTEGRVENFGDSPGHCVVRVWNRRCNYNPYGDEQYFIPEVSGGHGGADPAIVAEFVRFVRDGGKIATSAVAARNSVAAGCYGAESLRSGGKPFDIPPVDPANLAYFHAWLDGSN
ncbi:MAG TPA: Gfo/Idh/MocA family oxidoreductase [Lentisphaeria bacterium]|nr:Gfo/Idh/MocA family oxidoreductase [Lentisphaeria bacterium]HQL86472.1 Gfo/Idh/MocA family oxidoreductase [Lentisphaeria bacterium]